MRSETEVGDILRGLGDRITGIGLNRYQLRTVSALRKCRTSALGGHVDSCMECGVLRISYNSCRNRHCPKCQGEKREEWIQARHAELLPVPYFHLVFTLPEELNVFCLSHPKQAYGMLFQSAWETLNKFGQTKHLKMGMIAVLHTWGQTMSLHPSICTAYPAIGLCTNQTLWYSEFDLKKSHTSCYQSTATCQGNGFY